MIVIIVVWSLSSALLAVVVTTIIVRAKNAATYATIHARLEERDKQLAEQKQLLDPSNGQLKQTIANMLGNDFTQLANKIIDEKTRIFAEQSNLSLKTILEPFKNQIERFQTEYQAGSHRSAKDQQQLLAKLTQTQEMNRTLSDQAETLSRALRGDGKIQGDWGEVTLLRILEQSGLKEGREYETQIHIAKTIDDDSAARLDVVVHLPGKRDVIIDAKVSLTAYSELFTVDTTQEQDDYLKQHAQSVRRHIKTLSEKAYQKRWQEAHPQQATLPHVLLYIPIEGAREAALKHDRELFDFALQKKIVLVSPMILVSLLQTIEGMWRMDRQNQNVEKIFNEAGKIYDKCVNFITSMEQIGGLLTKTDTVYREAMSRLRDGRGNLVKSVQNLKDLGAPTTKQLSEESRSSLS